MSYIENCRKSGLVVIKLKKTLPIYLVESSINKNFKDIDIKLPPVGWGNGYVALPRTHSLFGIEADEINTKYRFNVAIDFCVYDDDLDKWVIGFDTAHAWHNESHDLEYVKKEAIELRNQLFKDKYYQRYLKLKRIKNNINGKN